MQKVIAYYKSYFQNRLQDGPYFVGSVKQLLLAPPCFLPK